MDARPAARPRGPRRHGAPVLAPAERGRAHGRPAAGDRLRAHRGRRFGRVAARRRRDDGACGGPVLAGPGPVGRRPPGRAGSGRLAGRLGRRPRPRCSPSRPPVATCSPSSARRSAASRTSSSSSPPRHEYRGPATHRSYGPEGACNDRHPDPHPPTGRPVHRTLRRLAGGTRDPQVPVHPLGQGRRPRRCCLGADRHHPAVVHRREAGRGGRPDRGHGPGDGADPHSARRPVDGG